MNGTCLDDVRRTTAAVCSSSQAQKYVTIDAAALRNEVLGASGSHYTTERLPPSWEQDYHFYDASDADSTAQYILVLDAMNFCFWPVDGYEYHHLASSLKNAFTADRNRFSASALASLDAVTLADWLFKDFLQESGRTLARDEHKVARDASVASMLSAVQIEERARALREVGVVLRRDYEGQASGLIQKAGHNAARLVSLVTASFPCFRDHCVLDGMQVFLYKRAQIFVGDLWGAFRGQGLGRFDDIHSLTCFADYRIPQLLQSLGILRYCDDLRQRVEQKREIPAGSVEEIAIRAATVQVVEQMRSLLSQGTSEEEKAADKSTADQSEHAEKAKDAPRRRAPHAVQLDWLLWERGESLIKSLPPHHRTRTIYY